MRKRDLGILLLAALAIFFSLQVSCVIASCEFCFLFSLVCNSASKFAFMGSRRYEFCVAGVICSPWVYIAALY